MKKILLTMLLPITSAFAGDKFEVNDWEDPIDEIKVIHRYKVKEDSLFYRFIHLNSKKNEFGFRCDIYKHDNPEFMLTFSSKQAIYSPHKIVKMEARVDNGKVYDLKGRLYINSHAGGTIRDYPDEIIDEIRYGKELLIRIYNYNKVVLEEIFPLDGVNEALNDTLIPCQSSYSKEALQEIKRLKREKDRKIFQLENEYDSKIESLKTGERLKNSIRS